jgi:hypothetical protein
MTHRNLALIAAFTAVVSVAGLGGSTLARGMEGGRAGMAEAQKEKVEARKAEIKQRVEAKRAEVKQKLADKRLEVCERRQEKINSIFDRATEQNKKQLAVFQTIEERVKTFYTNKNLSTEGYDAAVANADEKEAAAVAAIEASTEVSFDCASTDAVKPGSAIKEAMSARHAALKDYRTAIKDLILVVKKGHGQQTNTNGSDDSTGTETETETEVETETGTDSQTRTQTRTRGGDQ